MTTDLTPFIKIPGGKRRVLKELISSLPENFFDSKFKYVEPFVGGGSLALCVIDNLMKAKVKPSKINERVFLNDKNLGIASTWNIVSSAGTRLLEEYTKLLELGAPCMCFSEDPKEISKANFLDIRNKFNKEIGDQPSYMIYSIKTTAKFLYLNKHCFNGLIRYNKSGEFNSPCGEYKNTQLLNSSTILKMSEYLEGELDCDWMDFQEYTVMLMEEKVLTKDTLVYFDPPYVPLSQTAKFTEYNAHGFGLYDQIRLKATIDYLTSVGVKVMLSNSSAKWVKDTYKDYNLKEIKAPRSINSVGIKRGKVSELIITNY
jgi:DNA adenine methylase